MDTRAIDTARHDTDSGVREPSSVPHRRDIPWPFKYSVTEVGIVYNTFARRKAERQHIEEALL